MPKSYSLFRSSSYRRKIGEKIELGNIKPWRITFTRTCVILTVFLLLFSLCGSVGADYVMPAPPQDIVITETNISVSLTAPESTVFINVTEYDVWQIVKNVTVEFREPVNYVGFALEVLSADPNYEDLPRNKTVFQNYNETILQYYTIRLLTEPADEITNVTMIFAVEKAAAQESEGVTLMLYQYDGRNLEECRAEKFGEDDAFLYFETATERPAYIAVTRILTPPPWWFAVVITAIIATMAVIGGYVYRRFKLANRRKMVEA